MPTTGHSDVDPSSEKFAIASEILKGRELLGLTQAQLATQSGVSLSAIKGYETGRNFPGARELRQLCQVLRISPNRLIFGDENPFPERTWSDPSVKPVSVPTSRRRIPHLLQLLSSGECDAIFQLAYALSAARHGVEAPHRLCATADLETGVDTFAEAGPFIPYLHRKLLVDTAVAREYAAALLVAADETDKVNARSKVGTPSAAERKSPARVAGKVTKK